MQWMYSFEMEDKEDYYPEWIKNGTHFISASEALLNAFKYKSQDELHGEFYLSIEWNLLCLEVYLTVNNGDKLHNQE